MAHMARSALNLGNSGAIVYALRPLGSCRVLRMNSKALNAMRGVGIAPAKRLFGFQRLE